MNLQEIVNTDSTIELKELNSVLASEIQNRLVSLGCLDPPVDGKFGPISRLALGLFAEKAGVNYDDETIDKPLAQALIEKNVDQLFPVTLGEDLGSRIIKYMRLRNYWFARLPNFTTIVYLEGADENGEPNADKFDEWNDRRIVFVIEDGKPKILLNVLSTTEPGRYYTMHPASTTGAAARIAFGQYKAWSVGTHKQNTRGAHEALVQTEIVPVHRDRNKDGNRTGDRIDASMLFGINQHSGHNQNLSTIGLASAGCLVARTDADHRSFMRICKSDPRFTTSNGYRFMTAIIAGDDMKLLVP